MIKRCISLLTVLLLLAGMIPDGVSASGGVNWTTRASGTVNDLKSVTYGNGKYVAVGVGGTILNSADGASWTSHDWSTSYQFNGVTYGSNNYVAVGFGGAILTSSNGTSWTFRTAGAGLVLEGVAYGNGTYVAVGDSGTILTSIDGGNSWTTQTSGTLENLYGVTYDGIGTFVAVGQYGKVLTSNNGVNWISRTSGTSMYLIGITHGNGKYVAVGGLGTIVTSNDGVSWTNRTSGTSSYLYGVSNGNDSYVALGRDGTILASNDGINWMSQTSGTTNYLNGIAYGNGIIVAVGDSGTILQVNPTTNITAFDAIGNVAVGTAGTATYANAGAVSAVLLTSHATVTANSGAVTVPVTAWADTDSYNPAVAGSYTFTARLGSLPVNTTNTSSLTATVEVVVAPAAPVTPEIIDITSFDAIGDISMGKAGEAKYDLGAKVVVWLMISHDTVTANGGAVRVPLTAWTDTDGYDPTVAGSYTFTATLGSLPRNTTNTSGLTATVEVVVEPAAPVIPESIDITSFDAIGDISMGKAGEAKYDLGAKVVVRLMISHDTVTANGGAVRVPITAWTDTDGYDPTVAGSYTFTATLGSLPRNTTNTNGLTATVEVVVEPAPSAAPVTSTDGKLTLSAGRTGEVTLQQEVTVSIPAGATNKELKLTIEKLVDTQNLLTDQDVLASPIFEILKNFSENFSKPVTLTFMFDPTKLKGEQKPSVFYYDEVKKTWVEVGGKVNGNNITVEVNHFTKYAVMAVGLTDATTDVSFSDISGNWAEASIKQAVDSGIVKGYVDGTFKPGKTVTRAEFVVMLMNTLKRQEEGVELTFTDSAKIGAWAQKAVAQAVQAGIINGYEDGSFRPDAEITRAEMAAMIASALSLALESTTSTDFTDDKDIPEWAKGAVAAVKKLDLVEGKGTNEFDPNAKTTRGEAVTVLLKMLTQKSN